MVKSINKKQNIFGIMFFVLISACNTTSASSSSVGSATLYEDGAASRGISAPALEAVQSCSNFVKHETSSNRSFSNRKWLKGLSKCCPSRGTVELVVCGFFELLNIVAQIASVVFC